MRRKLSKYCGWDAICCDTVSRRPLLARAFMHNGEELSLSELTFITCTEESTIYQIRDYTCIGTFVHQGENTHNNPKLTYNKYRSIFSAVHFHKLLLHCITLNTTLWNYNRLQHYPGRKSWISRRLLKKGWKKIPTTLAAALKIIASQKEERGRKKNKEVLCSESWRHAGWQRKIFRSERALLVWSFFFFL